MLFQFKYFVILETAEGVLFVATLIQMTIYNFIDKNHLHLYVFQIATCCNLMELTTIQNVYFFKLVTKTVKIDN